MNNEKYNINTRNYYLNNIPIEGALESYFKHLENYFDTLETEEILVTNSHNRISAEPIFANISSPNLNLAAMDGIACHHLSTIGATETSPITLQKSKFEWIDTGDPIDDKFNAVIMIEDVSKVNKNKIKIYNSIPPMNHVREIGEDLIQSEMIIPENKKINHYDIGVCLAGGINKIKVKKVPKVRFIPTGSELINLGDKQTKGDLIEFNSYIITGILNDFGAISSTSKIIKDNKLEIENEILKSVKNNDIILVSAGSSAGSEDYTKEIISKLGHVIVHGVSIKPGHPVILGEIQNKPVIGLPGYPISAILITELIIKPIIEKKLNHKLIFNNTIKAKLARKLNSVMGEDEYIRATVGKINNEYVAVPLPGGAGVISSIQKANCLIKIPRNKEGFEKNQYIDINLLTDINKIDNTIICSGSHDIVLDLLKSFLLQKGNEYDMSINPIGSLGGLLSIDQNLCHMSGTHIFDPETNTYNTSYIKKFINKQEVEVINLVNRIQGIIVAKGNPEKIKNLQDLNNKDLNFVNRQKGSGTRILLDYMLDKEKINPSNITGYENEKNSHLAVSYAIYSGNSNVGLGIMSAAKSYNLDFIPLKEENFDIVIPKNILNEKYVELMLNIINSLEFKKAINNIGGYITKNTGKQIKL